MKSSKNRYQVSDAYPEVSPVFNAGCSIVHRTHETDRL